MLCKAQQSLNENPLMRLVADGYGLDEQTQRYRLTPEQAQAILDLRLHRLTGLEQDKILNEYREQLQLITNLLEILNNAERLRCVIREELLAAREEFADSRRTEIVTVDAEINEIDLVPEQEVVVTLSQAQRRGGRGKSSGVLRKKILSNIY